MQRLDLFVDCPGSIECAHVVCVEPELTIDPEQLPVAVSIAPPGNAASPPPSIAPFDEKQARAHQAARAKHLGVPVKQTNSIGMELVLIPPGEFMMGSPATETGRAGHEGSQHGVQITRPITWRRPR